MRRLGSVLSIPAALGILSLTAGGCADNESALFVRGVLALRSPDCEVTADPSSLQLLGGVYDVQVRSCLGYTAALLVGNQMVRRGSRDQVRTETSRIVLEGAEVNLQTESGSSISEFTVAGTGFVDPGTGEDPGYGVMSAMLIPPNTGAAGRVIAEVRVFGTTLGGDEIESAPLKFPITICTGCLISVPAGITDFDPATGTCSDPAGLADDAEPPCAAGQDEAVDCRFVGQICN